MANNLANILPKILARSLVTLRETMVMPRLVNSSYSTEAREEGDTIDVPVPSAIGTMAVTPSNTPPAGSDYTPGKVQIALDQWRQNDPFHLTDKEQAEIDKNKHFLPMAAAESVRALGNEANAYILGFYTGVYGAFGDATKVPFDTTQGVTSATQIRKILNNQLCPRDNRRGVVSMDTEANMLGLDQFHNAEKVGSNDVVIAGEIGTKYGIQWVAEDAIPTHTAGTSDDAYLINGTPALDAKVLPVDGGTGTYNVGDLFTIAGDTQHYVVTTLYAGGAGNIAIEPGLKVAPADDAVITDIGDHKVNLVFHRDAFAFAQRSIDVGDSPDGGSTFMTMQDPQTGIVLRLEVSRQHKRTAWEFDLLYGAQLVRPELAARLIETV